MKINEHKSSYILSATQGKVWKLDKNRYTIDNLKPGKVSINAYKILHNKKRLITSRSFTAVISDDQKEINKLKVSPHFSISGYEPGEIPISVVKAAGKIDINPKYKIVGMTVYASPPSGNDLQVANLNTGSFDEDLKELLTRIQPGYSIIFDNVEIINTEGRKLRIGRSINFLVTE